MINEMVYIFSFIITDWQIICHSLLKGSFLQRDFYVEKRTVLGITNNLIQKTEKQKGKFQWQKKSVQGMNEIYTLRR